MKFKFTFLSSILLLSLFQLVQGQNNESDQTKLRGFSMSQTFRHNGFEFKYHLSTDDVKDTPSWNPWNGDPPLTLQNALRIAQDNLKRFVKKPTLWDVSAIKLEQVDTQKWIYDISFACLKSECYKNKNFDVSFNVWVKMDSSIVEPEIKTKEKQNVR